MELRFPALAQSKTAETDLDASERAAQDLFARADANGDGTVSYSEFSNAVQTSVEKQIEHRFKQLDRNGDGRCTRTEVNKMDARRFARFDLNRDGAFTRGELARVIGRQLSARLMRLRVVLDRDGDQSLSVAELTRRTKPATTASTADNGATRTAGQF